jgi:hypothetical protein
MSEAVSLRRNEKRVPERAPGADGECSGLVDG